MSDPHNIVLFPATPEEYEDYCSVLNSDPRFFPAPNTCVTFTHCGVHYLGGVSGMKIATGFLIFYVDRAGDNSWISSEDVQDLKIIENNSCR